MSRVQGDQVLVRRAARSIGLRIAVLVGVAMLGLVALVAVLVVRQQDAAADSLLRRTAATADDVGDPPPATWLVIVTGSSVESSPGLPARLREPLEQLRAHAGERATLTTLHPGEGEFRVLTRQGGRGTVQVALDRGPTLDERERMLRLLGGASVAALVFAALLGLLVGRRAVRPMADALSLQRAFIADASHELRTPLTLLSTRAQVLDRELTLSGLPEALLEDSRGVVHDVQRLGEVVEDLLVAADPRADADHVPIDLGELVQAAVASARAHAAEAGVTLTGPSETAGGLRVLGSASALRRALLSLVDNAVDHTPPGGRVTIEAQRDGRQVVVTVTDTGPGVPPDEAGRVLRRFHSGGQRSARAHYGLGLALTNDVANRHGGQLRLASGGPGASFELVLPALRD